jgi:acyl-CoA thioesterase FadM
LIVKEIMPSTDKKGEIMSWENALSPLPGQVRFGDTDPYGIVLFCQLLSVIIGPLKNISGPLDCPEETFRNVKEGFGLPIVEAHGKFIRPSRYGDLLEIETRVQEVRTKAIIFHFRFFPAGQDQLMAEGTANMVAISREWRAIPIPERVLSRLTAAGQPAGQPRERG